MNAIDVTPHAGDLGIAKRKASLRRGDKSSSVLWERIRRLDDTRMPPLGTHRVDQEAVTI